MDELTPFERRLATELDRMAGRGRRIDAPALVRTVATRSVHRRRLAIVRAARYAVVAVGVVAGASVLSGVLPRTTEDASRPATGAVLLPGLDTHEVEPGVLRVLDDGAGHDLAAMHLGGVWTGADGSIWVLEEPDGGVGYGFRLLRLGRAGDLPIDIGDSYWFDMAVDLDGTVWAREGADLDRGWLASNDGTTMTWRPGEWAIGAANDVEAVETGPDGSIWVARAVKDGPGPWVAQHGAAGWAIAPRSDDPELQGRYFAHGPYMGVGPDGTVWLANGNHHRKPFPNPSGVLRFDGTGWAEDPPVPERTDLDAGPLAVGADGTVWTYLAANAWPLPAGTDRQLLARRTDGTWRTFGAAEGVPRLVEGQMYEARLAVDQAGTLWIAFADGQAVELDALATATGVQAPSADEGPCPGVLSFDGTVWRQYLRGRCVNHVAVAADGSIWASAATPSRLTTLDVAGLYLITPAAERMGE